jgi:hypothetical protein
LSILDPGSKKRAKKERGEKKLFCPPFFVATNITKLKIILLLNWKRKKFRPIYKEFKKILTKKLSLSSQIYRFGIRDPENPIPDPGAGVKKAQDPDPQLCFWPILLLMLQFVAI